MPYYINSKTKIPYANFSKMALMNECMILMALLEILVSGWMDLLEDLWGCRSCWYPHSLLSSSSCHSLLPHPTTVASSLPWASCMLEPYGPLLTYPWAHPLDSFLRPASSPRAASPLTWEPSEIKLMVCILGRQKKWDFFERKLRILAWRIKRLQLDFDRRRW